MPRKKKAGNPGMTEDATKEIARLGEEASGLVAVARDVAKIVDAGGESEAAGFLKGLKVRREIAEAARLKLVKPLNDHVKMINYEFKKVTAPIDEADAMVRRGMTAYRSSQTFKDAEARRYEIEDRARVAIRAGDTATLADLSEAHAEASIAAPRKVVTDTGETRFRKVWRFEIADLEALPAGYWMPDEKKIKTAVDAGVPVAGVNAWTEDVPIVI
jgi:hypothetical protein